MFLLLLVLILDPHFHFPASGGLKVCNNRHQENFGQTAFQPELVESLSFARDARPVRNRSSTFADKDTRGTCGSVANLFFSAFYSDLIWEVGFGKIWAPLTLAMFPERRLQDPDLASNAQ